MNHTIEEPAGTDNTHTLSVSIESESQPLTMACDGGVQVAAALLDLGARHGRDLNIYMVWVEDGDDHVETTVTVRELIGARRRRRVHLHRCHRVEVAVEYNHVTHRHNFGPGRTVRAVLEWVVSPTAFNIESEAHDLELQVAGTVTPLEPHVHIGTLLRDHTCTLALELVPKDRPQG